MALEPFSRTFCIEEYSVPVVPYKAVVEVSKVGNQPEKLAVGRAKKLMGR